MPIDDTFDQRCDRAKKVVLDSPLFENIYIGVFRSVDNIPNFYACNNSEWMSEYLEKELWFIDPIVKQGVNLPEDKEETLFNWQATINDSQFLEYRDAFIGQVKGFSKVLKHDLPEGEETQIIGIGLHLEHIDPDKPLNVSAIFKEAEVRMNAFIQEDTESHIFGAVWPD